MRHLRLIGTILRGTAALMHSVARQKLKLKRISKLKYHCAAGEVPTGSKRAVFFSEEERTEQAADQLQQPEEQEQPPGEDVQPTADEGLKQLNPP